MTALAADLSGQGHRLTVASFVTVITARPFVMARQREPSGGVVKPFDGLEPFDRVTLCAVCAQLAAVTIDVTS